MRNAEFSAEPELRSPGAFLVLVRHFIGRFLESDPNAADAEDSASLAQILGLLAVPGAFFVLLFRPLSLVRWDLDIVRYFFVAFSMIVLAVLTLLKWDALFPDRRDYLILMPLPIRLPLMSLAKVAALAALIGLFLGVVNAISLLMWPGIDTRDGALQVMLAHALVILASGLFAAIGTAAIQGVLMILFSGVWRRRAVVILQTLLLGALVMLFFLIPYMALIQRMFVETNDRLLYWLPPYWFIGLYERILPATSHPKFLELGIRAERALALVTVVFIATYLPGYRRHARKVIEAPEPNPRGPGMLRRLFEATMGMSLSTPAERAVFHYITQTIARSVRHRIFLAVYAGFGCAVAVMNLGPNPTGMGLHLDAGPEGLPRLPYLLTFILISGLRAAFSVPAELPANWSFLVNESPDGGSYLRASRKWVMNCGVAALILVIVPILAPMFSWQQILFKLAMIVATSFVLMEVMFWGFRKVPFTCSWFPGKANIVGLTAAYMLGFMFYSRAMAAVEAWLWSMPGAAAAFFLAAGGIVWFLEFSSARPIEIEYEGAGDPEVRTLGLTTD